MKPFSGKTNQNLQNGSIWNFARGSILEIGFEATFKSKTNVLNVWKGIFFFFTFFSEQVENVFGGSKGKHKKLCKSEVGHRKHFRKWFWNYLEVKSRCTTEPLKKTIFIFLHICEPWSWNRLLWKQGKVFKSLWIQIGHGKHFRKWFRSHTVKPECSEPSKRTFLRSLQIFEWQSWNHFLGKWGKALKVFKSKFVNKELLRTSMGIVFV